MDEQRRQAILQAVQGLKHQAKGDSGSKGEKGNSADNQGTVPNAPVTNEQAQSTPKTESGSKTDSGPEIKTESRPSSRPPSTAPTSRSVHPAPRRYGKRQLVVNGKRQKGNPVLKHIRDIPIEYESITPDFITGATSCVLFLSLDYHLIHPEYIYNRIAKLGKDFELRILMIKLAPDLGETKINDALKELTIHAMFSDFTVVVVWSDEEAARYLTYLKSQENASPTFIQGQTKDDYDSQLQDVVTTVRGVNRNDAMSLVSTCASFKNALAADTTSLSNIVGWGELKAKRFINATTEPFIQNKDYKMERR
uniref:ARAD1D31482p n=1 Tax=Blastobotrys adeninivorans TaxID=409370 RepID=A0A060TB30_BLAAD